MHSFIYQIKALNRPTNDELIEESYYDESDLHVFYIDYMTLLDDNSERRKIALENLKDILPETMFKVEGDVIEVISDGKEVFEAWKEELLEMVNKMEYDNDSDCRNSFCSLGEYLITKKSQKIIDTYSLFSLFDEHDDAWETLSYSNQMFLFAKRYVGQKLYVGNIFDYHF